MSQVCIDAWRGMGYRVAIWRDIGDVPVKADLVAWGQYQGYAKANNHLAREVMRADNAAQWLVFGGDDIWPDATKRADEIAAECTAHFDGTFGAVQFTGDRWGEDPTLPNLHPMRTAYIDRVCGSPWLGREWCQRANQGAGPFHPAFAHMFVDEFLQRSAQRLGVLWQRPDLKQEHKHWQREKRNMPAYLQRANSPAHWKESKAIFDALAADDFAAGDPLGECRMRVDVTKHHDISDAYRFEFNHGTN